MKEYKVINPKLGLGKWNQKIEDLLNKYAKEGWEVKHIQQNLTAIVLERDKNR